MFAQNLDKLIRVRKASKTALCKHLEISRTTLDDYLNEKTFMTSDKIVKTAAYFNVSVGSLFGEVEDGSSITKIVLDQQRQINEIAKQLKSFVQ